MLTSVSKRLLLVFAIAAISVFAISCSGDDDDEPGTTGATATTETSSAAATGAPADSGEAIKLGIRPEHLQLGNEAAGALRATVDFAEYLGSTRYLYCYLHSGDSVTVEQRGGPDLASGETVWLTCPVECLRLFSATGERLRPAGAKEAMIR